MKRTHRLLGIGALIASAALLCAGCTATPEAPAASAATVTVTSKEGPVTVSREPQRVVALDNTSFETLRDWGVTPVALPKKLLPSRGFEQWRDDQSILDIGNHREPDLEALSAVKADLIISGYRFSSFDQKLADLNIAPVIDIAASGDGSQDYIEGLKAETRQLGAIFNRAADAEKLVSTLEEKIAAAAKLTKSDSVFLAVATGGHIDNGTQRLGRIIAPLNLHNVFPGEGGNIHEDSGLSPETIASKNPAWAIVMDRDAALAKADATPAQALFAAQEAFAQTTFTTKKQIIFLDTFFYLTEGIEAYTQTYQQISDAFSHAG